jgi:heme/copper-type cytochrome/quinol oxidase subunit 4
MTPEQIILACWFASGFVSAVMFAHMLAQDSGRMTLLHLFLSLVLGCVGGPLWIVIVLGGKVTLWRRK